jgi:hypothetical protein
MPGPVCVWLLTQCRGMDPKDFLSLAKELRKRNDPAAFRSAISRAYYYAFVSARKFVGRYVTVSTKVEAHRVLPQALKDSGDAGIRDIADQLEKLRVHRNEADYDVEAGRPEKQTHVDVCLKMAEQIILDLVAAIDDPARWNKAVAEMKRCESARKA